MTVMGMTVAVVAMFVADVVVMRVLVVIVHVAMPAARIGPAFRIEWRFDFDHARAKPLHHVLDHMVAADTKSLADNLRRQMTIAEMPGDTHEMMRIVAPDFDELLRCGNDFDQPPVFQHQRIAAAQRKSVLKIEQKLQASRSGHRHAAAMTIVVIEHDGVGGGLGPLVLRKDFRRSDQRISTFSGVMISILVGALMHSFTMARHGFM